MYILSVECKHNEQLKYERMKLGVATNEVECIPQKKLDKHYKKHLIISEDATNISLLLRVVWLISVIIQIYLINIHLNWKHQLLLVKN